MLGCLRAGPPKSQIVVRWRIGNRSTPGSIVPGDASLANLLTLVRLLIFIPVPSGAKRSKASTQCSTGLSGRRKGMNPVRQSATTTSERRSPATGWAACANPRQLLGRILLGILATQTEARAHAQFQGARHSGITSFGGGDPFGTKVIVSPAAVAIAKSCPEAAPTSFPAR
jgi:hypothetical protein